MEAHTFGILSDRDRADAAITRLEERGYTVDELSVLVHDLETYETSDRGENVMGGTLSGAATGGVVGGLAGLLVGIGAIAIPGVGGLLAAGPVAAALGLTGAAATTATGVASGAVAGGLLGALVGLGVPEETAQIYEQRVRDGGVLLAVPHSHITQQSEVEELLAEVGAESITTVM